MAVDSSSNEITDSSNNNNNFLWGQQPYRRVSSSVSLASAANSEDNFSIADYSFHTCYDADEQTMMSASRVPSFGCLEDVMEEDFESHSHNSSSNNSVNVVCDHLPSWTSSSPPSIVPLQSFSQLQQQPLSPQLTAARLALFSDIGVLRRSMENNHDQQKSKLLAKTLLERDQIMESVALPMSRCFATPRMAVGTAFRTSVSASSMSSLYTAASSADTAAAECTTRNTTKESESDSLMMPPPLSMEDDDDDEEEIHFYHEKDQAMVVMMEVVAEKESIPPRLEDLADDVQVQILSFLPLADVRSVMATNGRYRKLLFTQDAQNLWQTWCRRYNWPQVEVGSNNNNYQDNNNSIVLVDDLSLPTAARPSRLTATASAATTTTESISHWHHQANLSLLLSMAQSQPNDIDREQLHTYTTWRNSRSSRRSSRRSRLRLSTTNEEAQPLLHCQYSPRYQKWVVQFTGRVGHGDRCIRSDQAFPRPTLLPANDHATWILPPSSYSTYINKHYAAAAAAAAHYHHHHHHGYTSSSDYYQHHSLLDLFCRSARAVASPRPAWRPFVAPFLSKSGSVHLTPRFVSYFEVSIMEPTNDSPMGDAAGGTNNANNSNNNNRSSTTDCVAVGVATERFDWHARMPGWDASSFGYHGDDGGIFHSSGGMLRKFGPSYGRGDVVGCGIDHVARGIFFTLNGNFLGYGWTGLPLEVLEKDLYPVVGIDTNDWIHCNFGTEPFEYDLKSMIVRHEDLVHQSLAASAESR